MSEHRSQHDPATDPPGAISNQNREENQSGHREDGTHPEPRTRGQEPKRPERGGDEPTEPEHDD